MDDQGIKNKENYLAVHGGLVSSELRALGLSRDEVIDFSVNINPLGPPPAAQAVLQELDMSSYPDPECLELKEKVSATTGVSMNKIVIGNGTTELIHNLVRVCAGLSDNVAVFTPAFGEYETATQRSGARLTRLAASRHHGFMCDIDAVCRRIRTHDPDLVFLCNPNNPTGRYLGKRDVTAIARAVKSGLLVIDDSYIAFADDAWNTTQLLKRKNVIILHSMTKEYAMAGLRLGYALCPEPVTNALAKYQPSWSVNAAAQAAGLAALNDRKHLDRGRKCIEEGKTFLINELRSRGLAVLPSAVNFFLVHVGDAQTFRRRLLTKGICVRDCSSFGLSDYIRIGIRTIKECEQLVDAIEDTMPRRSDFVVEKGCRPVNTYGLDAGNCV